MMYRIPPFKTIRGNTYTVVNVYKTKSDARTAAAKDRKRGYKSVVVQIKQRAEYMPTPYHKLIYDAPSYAVYADFCEW